MMNQVKLCDTESDSEADRQRAIVICKTQNIDHMQQLFLASRVEHSIATWSIVIACPANI